MYHNPLVVQFQVLLLSSNYDYHSLHQVLVLLLNHMVCEHHTCIVQAYIRILLWWHLSDVVVSFLIWQYSEIISTQVH